MAHQAHQQPHGHNPNLEYDAVDIGAIVKFMAYLIVVTVVVHFFVLFLMRQLTAQAAQADTVNYPLALEQGERLPPLPRLQTQPKEELNALRASWAARLAGYSWVDKGAGVVRLPIEEAKKRVLAQGFPVRSAQSAAPAPAAAATAPAENAEKR